MAVDFEPAQDSIVTFGRTNFRNMWRLFGIKRDDRRRHMYLIGKTGMGKSTVLENMMVQDIHNGEGIAIVDPHGDTVERLLNYIPQNRINDVVYFNPADIDYPFAFNVLEAVDETHRYLIASGLIGVFKKIWVDSWGPRLEYVLRNTILALLENPGSTLLGVTRLLVDKKYREKIVSHISDPIVRSFWVDEYAAYSDKFRTEAISPIQNKVGQFLSSAIIRNIVGQSKSSIDLREAMDNRKIILINLSKGRVGEDNSSLLGAMLITKLQLAAMSRIDTPEEERKDFYLYVDEFQNFATESFAAILSEARKYRLNLIIAHQYIEQLDETVSAAVFGNVGSMVVFRVGANDAEELVKEFTPTFTEDDLVNLTKYNVYLKLMIDGVSSSPFSALTLPPLHNKSGHADKVIKVSRERYGQPRSVVEDKIIRWSGLQEMMKEQGVTAGGDRSTERPREQQRTPWSSNASRSNHNDRPKREEKREQPDFTQRAHEEQPVVVDTGPAVSLADALGSHTVSFKGSNRPPRHDQKRREPNQQASQQRGHEQQGRQSQERPQQQNIRQQSDGRNEDRNNRSRRNKNHTRQHPPAEHMLHPGEVAHL
ncbi:MAG: type IV secretion system DNA-binding domain-containing protein [Patescibacteria group bacterium]|jgi:hypothetical protein